MTERYNIQAGKVECETIDDEVIIIQFDTGNYYTLSGLGAFIWQALDNHPSFDEILKRVSARYATDGNAQVTADVQRFLDELTAENLIARITSDTPSNADTPALAAERQPYTAPALERYSDMQALLVLDPIHEVDEQGWPHVAGESP